jgi:deoxycytidine triphosphate deaminase
VFLIPKNLLSAHIDNGSLVIDPFFRNDLGNTFYYFHAGDSVKIVSPNEEEIDLKAKRICQIPPCGFARLWSAEYFRMGGRVLGLFSTTSELIHKRGLSMVNSLSIDPSFTGRLEIGLTNQTHNFVTLKFHERIGKLLFFDVSDTYVLSAKPNVIDTKLAAREKGEQFTEDDDYPLDLGDA